MRIDESLFAMDIGDLDADFDMMAAEDDANEKVRVLWGNALTCAWTH